MTHQERRGAWMQTYTGVQFHPLDPRPEDVQTVDIAHSPPCVRHSILRANIRGNTTDGLAVRTRCGNWQLASDYDSVVAPSAVTR